MTPARIELMGGEKDGHEMTAINSSTPPQVIYTVPNAQDENIRAVRDPVLRTRLMHRHAVLAYVYDEDSSDPRTIRMVRDPSRDKPLRDDL